MLSRFFFRLIKIFSLILLIGFNCSCKSEETLSFSEISIVDKDETTIEINIPKAQENTKAAKQINTTLTNFVNKALNIEATNSSKINTKQSITNFKNAYKNFKTQIGKTLYTNLPPWEVLIDGEVLYKSNTLVSIAMNSSINTGAAHSNLVFRFYNFNVKNGKQLQTKDLINNVPEFTAIAKKYFEKELLSANNERINAFKNTTFSLPENLGFSKEGVIFFYDTFNTAANKVIEFTIPYTIANNYLSF